MCSVVCGRPGGTFRCWPPLITFAASLSHICKIVDVETNRLHRAVRAAVGGGQGEGGMVCSQVYYLLHAHTSTRSSTSRITFFCLLSLQQTCNSSHLLDTALDAAQMVLPWFIWQSAALRVLRRAIGFHSVSLELAHWMVAAVVIVEGNQ